MHAIIGFDLRLDDELSKFITCYIITLPGRSITDVVDFLKTRGVEEHRTRRVIELCFQNGTLELDLNFKLRCARDAFRASHVNVDVHENVHVNSVR